MAKEINYAELEDYLSGNLEKDEAANFQRRLSEDEALQQQLHFYQSLRSAQLDSGLDKFQATLQKAREQYQAKSSAAIPPAKQRWLPFVFAAAAVILLLIWLGPKLFTPTYEINDLYTTYAQHEFNLQVMGEADELGEIQSLLSEARYAESLPIINNYLIENPEAADILLAKGIALLETDNPQAALVVFNNLGVEHPIYQHEASWYQALAHLKLEEPDLSLQALEKIGPNSSRHDDAQELSAKINNYKSGN